MSPQRILREALAALIALSASAGAAGSEVAAVRGELLLSPVVAAGEGHSPNPYSFADLFNLTVNAQHGLVSGTSVSLARPDAGQPLTPALFGGAQVPGLSAAPGPSSTSMIGIPDAARPSGAAGTGAAGAALAPARAHAFQFEKEIFPLSRMPEPAGWLIAASALLVAGFIARRRSG